MYITPKILELETSAWSRFKEFLELFAMVTNLNAYFYYLLSYDESKKWRFFILLWLYTKGGQQLQHNFSILYYFSVQPWDNFPKI